MKTRDPSRRKLLEISNYLFLIAVLNISLFVNLSYSAPAYEDDDIDGGCYYMFTHYEEGDRILTNEPCLNCTCHNSMLMCYLRVCPFTKPIGQDCTVEKKPDQCCPIITCPEVPVSLVTPSQLISTTSTTTVGPVSQTSSSTDVGFPSSRGCEIDSKYYSDGAQIPVDPIKPCELCYCIRNRTACVMQECILHVEGCEPIFEPGVCCPVRYRCDLPPGIESTTTIAGLITTTVASFFLPTTTPPGSCYRDGEMYADGSQIPTPGEAPCEHCYCMRGEIVCAVQECGSPLESEAECEAIPPGKGLCCPEKYACHRTRKGKFFMMPNATLDNATSTTIQAEIVTTLRPAIVELSTEKKPIDDRVDNTTTSSQLMDQQKTTQSPATVTAAEQERATTLSSTDSTTKTEVTPGSTLASEGVVETKQTQSTEKIPVDSQVETTEHKTLDDDSATTAPESIEHQTTVKEAITTTQPKTVPSVTPAIEITTESMQFPTLVPHEEPATTPESQELPEEKKTTIIPETEPIVTNEIPSDKTPDDQDQLGEATTPHVSVVLPEKIAQPTTGKEPKDQETTLSPKVEGEVPTEQLSQETTVHPSVSSDTGVSEQEIPEVTTQPALPSKLSTEKLAEETTILPISPTEGTLSEKKDKESTGSTFKPVIASEMDEAAEPTTVQSVLPPKTSTEGQAEETTVLSVLSSGVTGSGIEETTVQVSSVTDKDQLALEISTKESVKVPDATEKEDIPTTLPPIGLISKEVTEEEKHTTSHPETTSSDYAPSTEKEEVEATTAGEILASSSEKPEVEEGGTTLSTLKVSTHPEPSDETVITTTKPLIDMGELEPGTTESEFESIQHDEGSTSRVPIEDMKLVKGKNMTRVPTESSTDVTPIETHLTSLGPDSTTKIPSPENLISTESPIKQESISRNDTGLPETTGSTAQPEKEMSTESEGIPVTTEAELLKPIEESATTTSSTEDISSKVSTEQAENVTMLPETEVKKIPALISSEATTEAFGEITTGLPETEIQKVASSITPEITTETPSEVSTDLPGAVVKITTASTVPEQTSEPETVVTTALPSQEIQSEKPEGTTSQPLDTFSSKQPDEESTTESFKEIMGVTGQIPTERTKEVQPESSPSTETETHKPADDATESISIVTESVTELISQPAAEGKIPSTTEEQGEVTQEPEKVTTSEKASGTSPSSLLQDQTQKFPTSSEDLIGEPATTEKLGTSPETQYDEIEKVTEKLEPVVPESTDSSQPSKETELFSKTPAEEPTTTSPEEEHLTVSGISETTTAPEIGSMIGEPSKPTTETAKATTEPEDLSDKTTFQPQPEESTVKAQEKVGSSTEKLADVQETTVAGEPSKPVSDVIGETSTETFHDEISEASTTTRRTVELIVTTGAVTMEPESVELPTTTSSEEVYPPANLTQKLDDDEQNVTITPITEVISHKEASTTESELIFESTTVGVTDTTAFSHMRIPGEGSCFVEGVTYKNGSRIPPSTPCQLACACQNSIVHCLLVHCPPAPGGYSNCKPVYTPNTCCPKYDCTEDTTPVTVTPVPAGGTVSTTPFVTVTPVSSVETSTSTLSDMSSEVPIPTPSEILHDDAHKAPQNLTDDRIDTKVSEETESPSSVETSTPSRVTLPVTVISPTNETTEDYNRTSTESTVEATTLAISELVTSSQLTTTTEEITTIKQAPPQEAAVRNGSAVSEIPTTIFAENATEPTTSFTTAKYPVTFSTTSVKPSPAPWPYPSSTTSEAPTISNGACLFDSRVYMSAQQIPRDDPCDFCFCFRGDIICLQQSCPPPIHGCYEEPIPGFCCPRYECPVGSTGNSTTSAQQLGSPSYYHNQMLSNYNTGESSVGSIGSVQPSGPGCEIQGEFYETGQTITSTSGPCLDCKCGATGMMECDPKECQPEPMLRKMIEAITSR